jgi:succinate dehydrogenase / fumarate reductase, cytochrome b subunit
LRCESGSIPIVEGPIRCWNDIMASTDAPSSPARARPLSPHLSVYRFTLTMAMSIVHRITGGALYVGSLLLVWFLIATSMDAAAFSVVSGFLHSIIGRLILFGFSWALFHHALGGLRHFIWEAGHGLEKPEREWLALGTLIGGFVLTIVVWAIGYAVR